MNENTSVKIRVDTLERLRLQYPDSSYNEIFATIASEEEFMGRQMLPPGLVKDANLFIEKMKKRFPDMKIQDIIVRTIKCIEESALKEGNSVTQSNV